MSDPARVAAVQRFVEATQCKAFASGCTMRLMSISETVEQQADMLLCSALRLRDQYGRWSAAGGTADVFVTNALDRSVHIITSDYLLHASPVLIRPADGTLKLRMNGVETFSALQSMHTSPLLLVGGAPIIRLRVGNQHFDCTLDTGAPGPVCLSAAAARKIGRCEHMKHTLSQVGVHGERVCSSIIVADVMCGGHAWPALPVFVNEGTVEHTDGYVGMGLLRAFDVLITPRAIGIRLSGLHPRKLHEYDHLSRGACVLGLCIGDGGQLTQEMRE